MLSTTVINEIWTYLISPVKAPPLRTQQFCAATWKSDRNKLFTKGRNTNGGLTTTSAKNKTSEPYWKQEYYGHQRSSKQKHTHYIFRRNFSFIQCGNNLLHLLNCPILQHNQSHKILNSLFFKNLRTIQYRGRQWVLAQMASHISSPYMNKMEGENICFKNH